MNNDRKRIYSGLLLALLTILAACSPTLATTMPATTTPAIIMPAATRPAPTALPSPQPSATQAPVSILSALANASYPIDITASGTAQLKDGTYQEAAAPGSASKITVALGKDQAQGDLNGDGVADAAVTLIAETGGSGTFTYLAAVINKNGAAEPLKAVLLGDRIIVKSLSIQSGQIEAEFLDHASNEPLALAPTLQVIKKFKVQDNQLVEVK